MVKDSNDHKETPTVDDQKDLKSEKTLDGRPSESEVSRREKNLLLDQYEQQIGLDEAFKKAEEAIDARKGIIAEAEQLWTLDSLKDFASECKFPELENADGEKKCIAVVYSGDYEGKTGPIHAYKLAEYLEKNPTVARDAGLAPDGYSLITIGGTREGDQVKRAIEQLKEQGMELSDSQKKEIWDAASENYAKQVNKAVKEKGVAAVGFVAKAGEQSTFKEFEEPMLTDVFVLTDAMLSKDGRPENSIDRRMFPRDKDGRIIQH